MSASTEIQSSRSVQYSNTSEETMSPMRTGNVPKGEFNVVDLLFTQNIFEDLRPQKLKKWAFVMMSPKKIFVQAIKKVMEGLPVPASREKQSSLSDKEKMELINILQSFVHNKILPKWALRDEEIKESLWVLVRYYRSELQHDSTLAPLKQKIDLFAYSYSDFIKTSKKKLSSADASIPTERMRPNSTISDLDVEDFLTNISALKAFEKLIPEDVLKKSMDVAKEKLSSEDVSSDLCCMIALLGNDIMTIQKNYFQKLKFLNYCPDERIEGEFREKKNRYPKSIANFSNCLTYFVAFSIIRIKDEPESLNSFLERERRIIFFHLLRDYLWRKGDYQSAMAIHSAFIKIKKMRNWDTFVSKFPFFVKSTEKFEALMSPLDNFNAPKSLFKNLTKEKKSFIPCLVPFLHNLTVMADLKKFDFETTGISPPMIKDYIKNVNAIINPVRNFQTPGLQTNLSNYLRRFEINDLDEILTKLIDDIEIRVPGF